MGEDERFVEEAETQYTEWKGTVAMDGPHDGVPTDAFGIDRERFGGVVAFSMFGGGEAGSAFR